MYQETLFGSHGSGSIRTPMALRSRPCSCWTSRLLIMQSEQAHPYHAHMHIGGTSVNSNPHHIFIWSSTPWLFIGFYWHFDLSTDFACLYIALWAIFCLSRPGALTICVTSCFLLTIHHILTVYSSFSSLFTPSVWDLAPYSVTCQCLSHVNTEHEEIWGTSGNVLWLKGILLQNLDVSQNSHHLLIFDIFTLLPLTPHVCDITGYYWIIPWFIPSFLLL